MFGFNCCTNHVKRELELSIENASLRRDLSTAQRELKLSIENASLRRDLSTAQRDLAKALFQPEPTAAPVCLHGLEVIEVPVYWLTTREEMAARFHGPRPANADYNRYTESAETAFQWVKAGN